METKDVAGLAFVYCFLMLSFVGAVWGVVADHPKGGKQRAARLTLLAPLWLLVVGYYGSIWLVRGTRWLWRTAFPRKPLEDPGITHQGVYR